MSKEYWVTISFARLGGLQDNDKELGRDKALVSEPLGVLWENKIV